MSRRRLVWAVVAAVVIAGALIAIGRWERDHHATNEMRGMRKVLAAIGPLDNPTLSMYRVNVGFGFDCLLYKRGANKFALEVCFDKSGRSSRPSTGGYGRSEDLEPARGSGRVDPPHRPCGGRSSAARARRSGH
jgi:hypothetical protein